MLLQRRVNLYKKPFNGGNESIESIFQDQIFTLEEPGIYTIQGPNQSGKSVLIKLLMGVPLFFIEGKYAESVTTLKDKLIKIKSVKYAIKNGMVAVFQDETLIPTMTIKEQILMRHANPNFRTLFDLMVKKVWNDIIIDSALTKFSINNDMLNNLYYEPSRRREEEIVDKIKMYLDNYGHPQIIDKLPMEISGGQKAIARLISAQVFEHTSILFLDEVFANVDSASWPKIISNLKEWRLSNNTDPKTIVAITHNDNEVVCWQPIKQFKINNGKIEEKITKKYFSIFLPMPKKKDFIPVYKPPYPREIFEHEEFNGDSFIITTQGILDKYQDPLNKIKKFVYDLTNRYPHNLIIDGDEQSKYYENYLSMVKKMLSSLKSSNKINMIIVIGGGSILNVGGFLAATIFRGRGHYIVVPTNYTALSDVVIGSKTSINVIIDDKKFYKNALGAYFDPDAILLDEEFFSKIPNVLARLGLVECLKHCLLQDKNLFDECYNLMLSSNPDTKRCIDISIKVMNYKADILIRYPWETKGGRILRYGHVFAHAIERASKFKISHSNSVFWGILIELKLAGNPEIFNKLILLAKDTPDLGHKSCVSISIDSICCEINNENHSRVNPYPAIILNFIGQYHHPIDDQLQERDVNMSDIKKAIIEVNDLLTK